MVQSPRITISVSELVTSLSIDVWPTSGKIGDLFMFNGELTQNGSPMPGYTVNLMLEKATPEVIASDATDSGGVWVIDWYANRSGTLTLYAEVLGLESKRVTIGIAETALQQWIFNVAPIATGLIMIKISK